MEREIDMLKRYEEDGGTGGRQKRIKKMQRIDLNDSDEDQNVYTPASPSEFKKITRLS